MIPLDHLSEPMMLEVTKQPILVGALTWTVPKGSPLKEDDVEELEEEAPNFDAKKGEEQDQLQIEDEPAGHEPVQGIFDDPEDEMKNLKFKEPQKAKLKGRKKKSKKRKRVRRTNSLQNLKQGFFDLPLQCTLKRLKKLQWSPWMCFFDSELMDFTVATDTVTKGMNSKVSSKFGVVNVEFTSLELPVMTPDRLAGPNVP